MEQSSLIPLGESYKVTSFGNAFQQLLNSERLKAAANSNALKHGGPGAKLMNFATGSPISFLDGERVAAITPGGLDIRGKNLSFGVEAPARKLSFGYQNNKGNFDVNAYAELGPKEMPNNAFGIDFRIGRQSYPPYIPTQTPIREDITIPFARLLNEKQTARNLNSPARIFADQQTKTYIEKNPYYYRSK